ncbi:TPA: replication initiator protein A [Staphylococcus aureus]|nr:replication initiator protein A [Staphylococcus aureus]HBI1126234.1 replication initiator protein A [Staphylococcus aureus]HDE7438141.1 replication initiator protein A [Staphylococcus aureus]HDE8026859.1 replication initiator protein A [Staphylococcus aureus]HDE8088179.1 replication initiator protein A [Staphylococcus aureus]
MQNQYFTVQENYKERFYQIPKVFFTSDNYKDLTNDMKIAYAILRDRLNLSIKNNWVDEDGNIYFIYSNEKLMEILNCRKEKLTKIKRALENAGLLIQKRRGLNKPNILYLMKPVVTECDIYKIEKEENDVETYGEKEVRKSNVQKTDNRTPGSSIFERPEVRKSNTNDTDFSDTDFSDTDFSEMNGMSGMSGNNIDSIPEINDHSLHSNHENDYYLIDEQSLLLKPLPKDLQEFIKSRYTLADSISIINKIMQAKREAANRRGDGLFFMFEENPFLSEKIIDILITVNREMKKKRESVQALLGYYYNSLVNGLEEYHFTEQARKTVQNKENPFLDN